MMCLHWNWACLYGTYFIIFPYPKPKSIKYFDRNSIETFLITSKLSLAQQLVINIPSLFLIFLDCIRLLVFWKYLFILSGILSLLRSCPTLLYLCIPLHNRSKLTKVIHFGVSFSYFYFTSSTTLFFVWVVLLLQSLSISTSFYWT